MDPLYQISKVKSVLNIQSHVVHGYVGNKASTFPLQMLDWDVDVLNTVNFSNHTGYGSFKGNCATADELLEIYNGLKNINIQYDAILTGYVHGYKTLEAVGQICKDIKKRYSQNNIIWLLDPVMGDEGELYVEENVIPIYKNLLETKLVDIITPNQYELEILINYKITCINSLKSGLKMFHDKYNVKHIVLSSLYTNIFEDTNDDPNILYCCISSTKIKDNLIFFKIDKINSYFTGVGDMFSALLLDRISRLDDDIVTSVNEVLSIMKKVLTITGSLSKSKGIIGDANMKDCELRVVECKNIYSEHNTFFKPIFINKN
jgi:pyridoxine kinase